MNNSIQLFGLPIGSCAYPERPHKCSKIMICYCKQFDANQQYIKQEDLLTNYRNMLKRIQYIEFIRSEFTGIIWLINKCRRYIKTINRAIYRITYKFAKWDIKTVARVIAQYHINAQKLQELEDYHMATSLLLNNKWVDIPKIPQQRLYIGTRSDGSITLVVKDYDNSDNLVIENRNIVIINDAEAAAQYSLHKFVL